MSDVKHARDAEGYLAEAKDPDTDSHETTPHSVELALVHAELASARALREIDTTIRLGFRDVVERLHGAPPADMIHLETPEGAPVWFNVRQFRSVQGDLTDPARTQVDVGGVVHTVKGSVVDVSAAIFQVVGSW